MTKLSNTSFLDIFHKRQRNRAFDFSQAFSIIRERGAEIARAGLAEDWEYTSGIIWQDGKPIEYRRDAPAEWALCLMSDWATPVLVIDGDVIDCWIYKDDASEEEFEEWWWPL